MGRSAKLHKRVQKKTVSSTSQAAHKPPAPPPTPKLQSTSAVGANVKRRAGLKEKAGGAVRKRTEGESQGRVLGGADYVSLMSGSRRRAREEAEKLPPA